MNRQIRRAQAKAKSAKAPRIARHQLRRPLPHEVDLVFADIDRFFRLLSDGLVDVDQRGVLVQQSLEGERYETIPAVLGFTSVWRRISNNFNLNIDVSPIEKLCKRLEACMPITPGEVEHSMAIILAMRRAYSKLDLYEVKSVVNTELIALELSQPGASK